MATTERDLYTQLNLRWRRDPVTYVQDVFGVQPDPWQCDVLRNIARPRSRTSVRACHGPGKSAVAAWALYWYGTTHYPVRMPCTATTKSQLEDVLWAELRKWHGLMRIPPVKSLFEITADHMQIGGAKGDSFAVARTARPDKPEALQGFHGNVLVVIDEAAGVPDAVFEVASGTLSEDTTRVAMFGNPNYASGQFYRSHTDLRDMWDCYKVGHADSPRVSDQYEAEMRRAYGPDSNVYRVRVLGEFPLSDDDAVISLELVESSVGREVQSFGDICWGLDVARFGDDETALCKRTANEVLEPVTAWRGLDTMQTSNRILRLYNETDHDARPSAIYVDSIGIGAGVADRLREMRLPCVAVNVAESPAEHDRYNRLRDELWWKTREWFESREVRIAEDAALTGQLTMPKYSTTPTGKISIERKEDMKRRGISSPDRAEALMLTMQHNARKVPRKHAATYSREADRRERERARKARRLI